MTDLIGALETVIGYLQNEIEDLNKCYCPDCVKQAGELMIIKGRLSERCLDLIEVSEKEGTNE